MQLPGPPEFPDAGSSQRRSDGLTFKGTNRLTVDENFNILAAGDPTMNAIVFDCLTHLYTYSFLI
jgi:hypothetical protein